MDVPDRKTRLITVHSKGQEKIIDIRDPMHPANPDSIIFIERPAELPAHYEVSHVDANYSAVIMPRHGAGMIYNYKINVVLYNISEIGYGTPQWRYEFPEHYLNATSYAKQFIVEVQRQFDLMRGCKKTIESMQAAYVL